jgi:hypothetical protein
VVIEESAESDGTEPVIAPSRGGLPFGVYPPHDPAGRFLLEALTVVRSRKEEPSPFMALRRIYDAVLTRSVRGRPRWSKAESRQGG